MFSLTTQIKSDLTDYIKPVIAMTNEITISAGTIEVLTFSVPSYPNGYKPIMAVYFNNSGSNDILPVSTSTAIPSDATTFQIIVKNTGATVRTTVRAYVLFIRNLS